MNESMLSEFELPTMMLAYGEAPIGTGLADLKSNVFILIGIAIHAITILLQDLIT